jgi:hypothetical protein
LTKERPSRRGPRPFVVHVRQSLRTAAAATSGIADRPTATNHPDRDCQVMAYSRLISPNRRQGKISQRYASAVPQLRDSPEGCNAAQPRAAVLTPSSSLKIPAAPIPQGLSSHPLI